MNEKDFMRLVYGQDVDMWEYVNSVCTGSAILTHENRHLKIDPSIKLIHLDDWEIQKIYSMKNIEEKLSVFKSLGIQYYLFVPNEKSHPVNRLARIDEIIDAGKLILECRLGENELYRFEY